MKYDYDLIVIGGGAAGLVAVTAASALGAKTALIEKNKLGGDCTWYGCIPSKTLLKSAQAFSLVKRLRDFGISISGTFAYDTKGVMSHVRDIVYKISTHHPPEVFEKRGIKVFFGDAKFIDCKAIELAGERIRAKRFIISTGSHPLIPQIEGIEDIDYLTNENIFDLEALPHSLAVLGGGPIGVEISQALSRLGVEIHIVEMFDRLLFREDLEAAGILTDILTKEGIKIYTGKKAVKFMRQGDLVTIILQNKNKNQSVIKVNKVFIAVGRAANVLGLELEKARVKYSDKGIEVDKTLKTTAKNIYACGDVVGPYQFSHMAEYQAVISAGNALFPFKRKIDYRAVTWCTFSDPEVAHLGLTEEEARSKYKFIKVYKSGYKDNDRAVTDLQEQGFAKMICDKRGRILGAHIIGASAGEIIHGYVLAKSAKLKITKITSAVHIYPTLAQIVKRTSDQYYLELVSSAWLKRIAKFFINLMR